MLRLVGAKLRIEMVVHNVLITMTRICVTIMIQRTK